MTQLPFEWYQRTEANEVEVVLDPQTVERVMVLMATALFVVVRGVTHIEEVADDER